MPVDYHAWTHRPKALGGTDPIAVDGTTAAYFDDWVANGTGASIANNTWVEVVSGSGAGANDRYFGEFFASDTDWGRNFANGRISRSEEALYTAWGFVEFDVIAGVEIGAAINFVGAETQVNYGVVRASRSRIIVTADRAPLGPDGAVSLQAYQLSGGAADLLGARLHVRRFELLASGEFETNPDS